MTQQEILARLNSLEQMISRERNTSTLKVLNECYQKLLDRMELPNDKRK